MTVAVREMLEGEIVSKEEKEKVKCISPITVAVKKNTDGSLKKKFCWDGSRMVNPCLRKMEDCFADLRKTVTMVEKGDYMFVCDLKRPYSYTPKEQEVSGIRVAGAYLQVQCSAVRACYSCSSNH